MNKYIYIILVCTLALTACHRTKPQSPANRSSKQPDSVAIALVMMNQRLAEEADNEVLKYVQANEPDSFVMGSSGYWYRRTIKTDNQKIEKTTQLDMHIVIYSIEGDMYLDSRESLKPDDPSLLFPVMETLTYMHLGESAELLIPWYAGYGNIGKANIPPYTNLRVTIETN